MPHSQETETDQVHHNVEPDTGVHIQGNELLGTSALVGVHNVDPTNSGESPKSNGGSWREIPILQTPETAEPEGEVVDIMQGVYAKLAETARKAYIPTLEASDMPEDDKYDYTQALVDAAASLDRQAKPSIENVKYLSEVVPDLPRARAYVSMAKAWEKEQQNTDEPLPRDGVTPADFIKVMKHALGEPNEECKAVPEQIESAAESCIQTYFDYMRRKPAAGRIYFATMAALREGRYTPEIAHDIDNLRRVFTTAQELGMNEYRAGDLVSQAVKYSPDGVTDGQLKSIREKLIPAYLQGDVQTRILFGGPGEEPSITDASNFAYKAYTSEITPSNLNELLLRYRLTPTSDLNKLEQNRSDAVAMQEQFYDLRKAIHRMEPGVHNAIKGMVAYYETGDETLLETAKALGGDVVSDRLLYDEKVPELNVKMKPTGQEITVIELLRRLQENTEQVKLRPPSTDDELLNDYMHQHFEASDAHKRATLQQALRHVNTGLLSQMDSGEVGMEPRMIAAVAWLEQESVKVVNAIDNFEDLVGAYKENWFTEIIRFEELITSPSSEHVQTFSETIGLEKNDWMLKIHQAQIHGAQPDYKDAVNSFIDDLRTRSLTGAYKTLTTHIQRNFYGLNKEYKQYGVGSDILVTTTLGAALQFLNPELKPAQTAVGRRLKAELEQPQGFDRTIKSSAKADWLRSIQ